VYGHSFSGSFKLLVLAKRQSPGFHEKRKPVRQLWGDGHGNFTTVGNGSSTSVRGTIWAIFDYPDGTLTRVYTDSVAVYDNHLRKTVVVRAGHFYFAALGNLPTCR
jgi:predicted ATP-dependent Lon-type protease